MRPALQQALAVSALAGCGALLWLAHDAPLSSWGIRLDALAALWLLALVIERRAARWTWRDAAGMLGITCTLAPLAALGMALSGTRRGSSRFRWLAAALLLAGYGWLSIRGAWLLDAPAAGAALDALAALLVIAAAGCGLAQGGGVIWLAPVLRLYLLAPWEPWWGLVGLLAGAALALGWPQRWLAGALLAAACLGTSAGVAAVGYGVLALALRGVGRLNRLDPATLVALWLACGAALAGGAGALVPLLLVAAYRAGRLPPLRRTRRTRRWWLAAGLALGCGAVVNAIIAPLVAQLQGGLSAYGAVEARTWVGLTVLDSAKAPVLTLPIVALALLGAVLAAAVVVLRRAP